MYYTQVSDNDLRFFEVLMTVLGHRRPGDNPPPATMRPVEGPPIPSGPRYLTPPPRYVTYNPDPFPAPPPEPLSLSQEIAEELCGFARQATVTVYLLGVLWWVLYVIGIHKGVL